MRLKYSFVITVIFLQLLVISCSLINIKNITSETKLSANEGVIFGRIKVDIFGKKINWMGAKANPSFAISLLSKTKGKIYFNLVEDGFFILKLGNGNYSINEWMTKLDSGLISSLSEYCQRLFTFNVRPGEAVYLGTIRLIAVAEGTRIMYVFYDKLELAREHFKNIKYLQKLKIKNVIKENIERLKKDKRVAIRHHT